MSMNTGVSGLTAASASLNTISNNIANANTTGYKSLKAQFADVYSATSASGGVYVADIETNFAQGNLVYTSSATDLAINGDGFFIMKDAAGKQYFTRAGNFSTDQNSNLTNDQGQQLMGYKLDANGKPVKGQLQPLSVNTSDLPARASNSARLVANLDSRKDAITWRDDSDGSDPLKFDLNNPNTYHSTTTSTLYDSQGNPQQISAYYTKVGDNQWEVRYAYDGKLLKNSDGSDYVANLGFSTNGALAKSTDNSGTPQLATGQFTLPAIDFNNGSASMKLTLDVTSISQYGNDFSVSSNTQNGYSAGNYYGVKITDDGGIVATYSNGQSKIQGYVALATFPSTSGLDAAGNTSWTETARSGAPIIDMAGTGTLGTLTGSALEGSNVDMSAELVNMIVAQSSYQANTKTISTFNDSSQYLLNTF